MMPGSRKQIPHVAILVETSRSHGREVLRGLRRYISVHGPWSVFVELRGLDAVPPAWLKTWRGDGILTRTPNQRTADLIQKVGVPTVELRASRLRQKLPFVGVDNQLVGQMVAEHFLDRGFRRFALYNLDTEIYFQERRASFIAAIERAGYAVSELRVPGQRERPADWERHQDRLVRWLRKLQKPVGLMACTDQLGFWLLDACHRAGISVPEEVAVVGVENDTTLCSVSTPPMSSVQFNSELVGFEAAAMLDRLMSGQPVQRTNLQIPPLGIVSRQSSEIMAIDDVDLVEALTFIRHHACEDIGVEDVLKAVPLSRSTLERRMRMALGRSPREEILRVKLDRVRKLLIETDLKLESIAVRTGFGHSQLLCERFKQKFGLTPGQYRQQNRGDVNQE
jgi:LacI family transcriptional regulator